MPDAASAPDNLLTTTEAAALLDIERPILLDWIRRDLVPYVRTPKTGTAFFRLPRLSLLSMIGGDGVVAVEFRAARAKAAEQRRSGA